MSQHLQRGSAAPNNSKTSMIRRAARPAEILIAVAVAPLGARRELRNSDKMLEGMSHGGGVRIREATERTKMLISFVV
jgi:hypothetical protein